MNAVAHLLRQSMQACQQRMDSLTYSLQKNQHLFPVTSSSLQAWDEEQQESMDALILRYSQCVTMVQEQLFKGIAYLEQEDLSDKSNRDKTLLMEKLGAIQSAEAFGAAAILRNKFAHHYPEAIVARLERLNMLPTEAEHILESFRSIRAYLAAKELI